MRTTKLGGFGEENEYILGRRCRVWIRLARRLLRRGAVVRRQQHVCFALHKKHIISIGINSYRKTHPKQREFARRAGEPVKEYLHAEISALVQAHSRVDSVLVLRVSRTGVIMDSAPCPVCNLALSAAGVTNIYHS